MDLKESIQRFLMEDIGDGDHTSLACIPINKEGKAQLIVKEKGIIAGVELAKIICAEIDPNLVVTTLIEDGNKINYGDVVLTIEGKSRSILKAERLILNCMQRMSGIATKTFHLNELISDYPTQILDTRKTTPGFRAFEKWAVKIGGGLNHRMGLYDMIMIKDNHIDYAGGIPQAIESVVQYLKKNNKELDIVIEVRNLTELDAVLEKGQINRILLDNFSLEDLTLAVEKINGQYETEASGSINEDTIRAFASSGVDYVSLGALTHQIKSLDLSLKAV